ncbi:hypothetical protein M422DRAFT_781163 [Sphaerobolus stellatus SS14]|uniref:Acyl-CoA desaturase n=1 Tax=Sphaerobolus stellatus (strain SS14) TaxID=990650 RepID=A0A0C9VMU9_SPHS4|nr:hypothetical protein M422DRAFT_781163 [Sphaerobolus stellatus SS14]
MTAEKEKERELPIIPPTWWALIKRLDPINTGIFVIPHLITFAGCWITSWEWKTFIFFCVYLYVTSTAFVAGYHRLWSHRAFVPTKPLEYTLAFFASAAFMRTMVWWARDHRAHHRYIDSELDPCMPKHNFFWRHFGWFTVRQSYVAPVDLSDLFSNPVVQWQLKWIWPMSIFSSFLLPMLVAGLGWGDWWGGLFYAGFLRVNIMHHGTLFANSLAHWVGDQHFDDRTSPKDFFFTNIVTFGEGYHNYHHQFPMDYRVGIEWWQFDPAKWFLYACYCIGLVTQINRAPENEIKKAELSMELKKLRTVQDRIKWATDPEDLPVVDWEKFQEESMNRPLVLIAGFIHDVSSFMDQHPGGRDMLAGNIGKDVTTSFFGGIYNHSNAAHNILSMLRVGVLRGGVQHVDAIIPPGQELRIVQTKEMKKANVALT